MKSLPRAISSASKTLVAFSLAGAFALADESGLLGPVGEALGPSGSARVAYFERGPDFKPARNLGVGSLWLQLKPKDVGPIRTFAEGRLVVGDFTANPDWRFDLREGYAETSVGPLDLRAGRMITVWGRADKVNPTDVFTTKDLTLLTTDDEEQRLGIAGLQASWTLGEFRLIGIWQGEWRRPRYPIPPLAGLSLQEIDPENAWQQGGLKLDRSGGQVDWSLSYSTTYDRFPDLSVLSAGPAGATIGLQHNRIHVFGGDLATTVGPLGLRAEAAYSRTKDTAGNDPGVKNALFSGVLGVEYSLIENLTVNAQYLYRHVFDFVAPSSIADPNATLLATQVALLSNQNEENQHGASVRVSYKLLHETLEPELAAVAWMTGAGWLVRPKVTYSLSDRVRLIGGAQFFGGPSQSFFGRLKDTSSGFAEIRFLF